MDVMVIILGVLGILAVVASIFGMWWLLIRTLNGDQTPEAGGSFGDQSLGERNTRQKRKSRKGETPDLVRPKARLR